ncbi:MAG: hypothetical protein ABMA14_13615 [Hyphomonadaceae bacterium]
MAVIRNETRPGEPTEKRIVEVTQDGKIVSSEPLGATAPPFAAQPTVQVIREKRRGSGAMVLFSLLLVLAVAGLGFYIYQTRDDTAAKQAAEMELQQQRSVAEQKLQELGQAADNLSDQVRDTQKDLGIPAAPSAATTPSPGTTAPVQPAAPTQPQTSPQ